MKLVSKYGSVSCLEDTGCNVRILMLDEKDAQDIIKAGKTVTESDRYVGYNRCVDGRYYFNAVVEDIKSKKRTTASEGGEKK
jgi:hypothetical protein